MWAPLLIAATTCIATVSSQTFTSCNPLTSGNCPPDSALGRSVNIDFTQGESDSFTAQGSPQYSSDGAGFTVAKGGDAPQLNSKWYLMFGHVEFVIKAAPGTGIVSSAVLQSDDLDEIDWEWLGGDDQQVQSNFFGKGLTTSYNRGAFHPAPGNHDGFKTYAIDWTADQIVWSIDGKTVRALSSGDTNGYPYPQTPMMIKVGAWSGGDPANAPGTIQWAGGPTNYGAGPYTMYLKSISATDYSTGSQYKYSGTDGSWQSITAVGGTVNSKGSGSKEAPAPAVSASSNSAPIPFSGTHKDSSSAAQPNAGGWSPTTMQTSVATATTYPGLPSGWTVTSSGKVLPPSSAPVTSRHASPSSSPQDSRQGAGSETITTYNDQGFPVTITRPAGWAAKPKHYDDKGFLVTSEQLDSRSSPTAAGDSPSKVLAAVADPTSSTNGITVTKASPTGAAGRLESAGLGLSALLGITWAVIVW